MPIDDLGALSDALVEDGLLHAWDGESRQAIGQALGRVVRLLIETAPEGDASP